ncbi:hypothetical protein MN608_04282 [Microdochium nivale]|nr:hypothetical protein MN608_04282 [Microdochium nivale]
MPAASARLLSLPQELFDEITKYLSPAGIVVLAMANKELLAMFTGAVAAARPQLMPPPTKHPYGVLGNYINDADHARSRYRGILLSILDMDLPALVYCYKCRRMHDPFVAFADRLYTPSKSAKCADYDEDSHIPPRATRKMLRAITKHRLRGGDDYRPLLQQVNNTSTTFRGGHVVQVSLVMRYRDDNMLLRRQQIVASIDKSPQALFLFRTQLLHASRPENAGVLKGIPRLRRPCNHLSWLDMYQKATDELLDPLCVSKDDLSDTAQHRDHTPPCFSRDHRDLALEPGNMISDGLSRPRQPRTDALGTVTGCDRCTTDVHLDIIALPEPYRWGFALTTWIDVGKIDLSKKWDSHRPDTGPHRDYPRDSEPKGSICGLFEDLGHGAQFEPSLSDLNRARLTNFGYVSAAAPADSGSGPRLSSWTVEHAVDPTTGRLIDPDPLTERDY